jgi:hypothetical protein
MASANQTKLAGYTKRKNEEEVMPKKPEGMDQDTYEGGENEASSYPGMPDKPAPKPKAPAPKPKAPAPKPKKMASGGYVSKADGCVQSGKTKGRFV